MPSSLTASMASLLINAISPKGVTSTRKVQEGGSLPWVALCLMIKAMSDKGTTRAGRSENNMIPKDKNC